VLAQKFLPTEFRLAGRCARRRAAVVCQYRMGARSLQVVSIAPDGSSHEGGFRAFEIEQAPARGDRHALRAARRSRWLLWVDLKQTDRGIV